MNTIHQQPVDPNTDVAGCRRSGGFQIVVGLLTLIFGIVSVCIDCEYSYFGTAIWGGVWFLVCGFIGASAYRASGSSAHCQLTGYLVLCIFSIIYALDLVVTMSVAISVEGPAYSFNQHSYLVTSSRAARIAIDSILLTLGVLEVCGACYGVAVASKTSCGSRQQTVVSICYNPASGLHYHHNRTRLRTRLWTRLRTGLLWYPPATVAVTTQYAYPSPNPHPGSAMPQQAGVPGAYPPPYQQKAQIGQQ
ncbi:hypothetical protein BSL78_20498 [Apostichopus japonicus]|uniref:Uncharacterized protein n=1 Tax=Stichopus japonicus TaxID=307972 RepID=A0A2G8K3Q3_STIJA|nr:hypothetical protein BSL78_20498 [Apostichopus japonicus]